MSRIDAHRIARIAAVSILALCGRAPAVPGEAGGPGGMPAEVLVDTVAGIPADTCGDISADISADISETAIGAWIRFLAEPELEGRESGTRGYDVAALYVAALLEEWGVRPLGDGTPRGEPRSPGEPRTYLQGFDLVGRSWDLAGASLTLRSADGLQERLALEGKVALAAGEDIDWRDPWVFAGEGRGALGDATDDYHGLEIEGRVVLLRPSPGAVDLAIAEAARRGARRVVVACKERASGGAAAALPELPERLLPRFRRYAPEVVFIATDVAARVLQVAGLTGDALGAEAPDGEPGGGGAPGDDLPRPAALDRVRIALRVPARDARRRTHNVVGWIEGSDPALSREHVAVGAHLDHVGIHDGKVYPGADDNASGVAAVLAVARAAAHSAARPPRSILVVFFAAEEKGLWGSEHFAAHPPVDLADMVLEVQLDMVGRPRAEEGSSGLGPGSAAPPAVHAIGIDRHSDELAPWLRSLAGPSGIRIEGGLEEFYERSDHYVFGSRGIPVVFLFTGVHEDYHQPTDTAEKIDVGCVARVARLAYAIAREVADRPARLRRNRV